MDAAMPRPGDAGATDASTDATLDSEPDADTPDATIVDDEDAGIYDPGDPSRPVVHGARFTEVTEAAGVSYLQGPPHSQDGGVDFYSQAGYIDETEWLSGGAAVGDYDGDGFPDIYVTRVDAPGILFRNRGDGTFEDVSAAAGLDALPLASNGAAFGDIDNDGDVDLYVAAIGELRFYLFINEGGAFVEQAVARGAAVEDGLWHGGYGVSFGDYDRDGWLDIHVCELTWQSGGEGNAHTRLLHNRGGEGMPGHFTDVTVAAAVGMDVLDAGIWRSLAYSSAFSDMDDDGWPELLVASDYGTSALFWNNRDGTFENGTVAASVGTDGFGMGSAIGDYDGDGHLDWFITSIYDYDVPALDSGNRLYRNNGDRTFTDRTDVAGVRDASWGWGTTFFETDNDGDLDLIATNGYRREGALNLLQYRDDATRLWENDGVGRMTEIAQQSGVTDTDDGKGLMVLDYDLDGDQDVFIVNHAGRPVLYRNDLGNDNDWLQLRLVGTTANRQAFGARVRLQRHPGAPVQLRELRGGNNFLGQDEAVVHFGLGVQDRPVHRIEIVWPTPEEPRVRQVLTNVPVNRRLVVTQP